MGFPRAGGDRTTGCLGAARECGERGQLHWVSGMNIWQLREEPVWSSSERVPGGGVQAEVVEGTLIEAVVLCPCRSRI